MNSNRSVKNIVDFFNDKVVDIMVKMSHGNPGAAVVLGQLIQQGTKMDADNVFGGFGSVITLDELGIYGSEIWILYKNICDENARKMVVLLRAAQLGIQNINEIYDVIDSFLIEKKPQKLKMSFEEMNRQVCSRLDNFIGI